MTRTVLLIKVTVGNRNRNYHSASYDKFTRIKCVPTLCTHEPILIFKPRIQVLISNNAAAECGINFQRGRTLNDIKSRTT